MTSNRLRTAGAILAVFGLVVTLGAGLVAAIGGGDGDSPSSTPTTSEDAEDSGWVTVSGTPGSAGAATYLVPGGADWEIHDASFAVSYKDKRDRPYASGHAASFYYGNDCTDGGQKVAAGWALLANAEKGSDLTAFARASARNWARGYGSGPGGTTAPMTKPVVEAVELVGAPAVSARVTLDMTVFEGACLADAAEVTVVSFATRDGFKSLVVARYLGVTGGISDGLYQEILGSAQPG